LGVGERIDAAIKIVRAHFLTLARAALVVAIPSGIVVAVISVSVRSSEKSLVTSPATGTTLKLGDLYAILGGEILTVAITFIVGAFITAVCFRVIGNAYLGQTANWRDALGFGWSRLLAVIWISVLTYLAVVVLALAVAVLIAVPVITHVTALTVLFSLMFGVGGLLAAVWFLIASRLAVPVMMLEDIRGTKAIRRALRLCRGHWWSVFGTQLLAGILVAVASFAVGIAAGAVFAVFHGSTTVSVVEGFLVQTINYMVFAPFSAAVLVVLTIDLRVRKEGFDIQLLSAQMGVAPSASALFFTKPAPGGGYGPAGYPQPPGYPQQPYPWYPPGPGGYPPAPPGYPPPGYTPAPPVPGWPRPSDWPRPSGWPRPSDWPRPSGWPRPSDSPPSQSPREPPSADEEKRDPPAPDAPRSE
jgi:hypothetical protein